MIQKKIQYERKITGSYMIIPAKDDENLDEKIILKRKITGLLPVEKCFVDGESQYWYHISGKQSLDMYCKDYQMNVDFMEHMIVSICSQIEILEWNLIDTNCLMLDPELIFISNQNQEIIFTVYPDAANAFSLELQSLMEFMLTKIDHKDSKAVRKAYGIYQKTMDDSYTIMDIRKLILEKRGQDDFQQKEVKEVKEAQEVKYVDDIVLSHHREESPQRVREEFLYGENKKSGIWKKLKGVWVGKKSRTDKCCEPDFVEETGMSHEVFDEMVRNQIMEDIRENPITVNIKAEELPPQGLLLYQGTEGFDNLQMNAPVVKIGKGADADMKIVKNTVSHIHARILLEENQYYLEDMNSRNGTYVNGTILNYKEKKLLKKNDIIAFADVKYRFV